jgi:hypothetical protein
MLGAAVFRSGPLMFEGPTRPGNAAAADRGAANAGAAAADSGVAANAGAAAADSGVAASAGAPVAHPGAANAGVAERAADDADRDAPNAGADAGAADKATDSGELTNNPIDVSILFRRWLRLARGTAARLGAYRIARNVAMQISETSVLRTRRIYPLWARSGAAREFFSMHLNESVDGPSLSGRRS